MAYIKRGSENARGIFWSFFAKAQKGAILFAIFLLAASVVFAAHSASVSTDYAPIYETTSSNFSLTVSNGLLSANSISNVSATLNSFSVLSTISLIGWQSNSADNILSFYTSDHKISNWGSQTFGFEIKAANVDQNQTVDWPVTTYDTLGATDVDTLQVLILNDYTAPVVSDVLPNNGSFIKQGTNNQQFSLSAVDPETGVSAVSGKYGLCDNLSVLLSFAKTNNSYLTTSDLSSYEDSTVLCYEYDAQSNGGEIAAILGQFTIDGVPPAVTLIFPENGVYMNNNSLFQYSASDNLAPTVSCVLSSDGTDLDSVIINSGDSANASVEELSEGAHSWNVSCTDLAGNKGVSESRTFTLDKTPPAINVTSPANGAVNKAGVPVNVTVTDNYGVSSIWYEFQNITYDNITSPFSVNTDSAEDGENLIAIHATDVAGNEAVLNYIMIVDRKAPEITFTAPEENGTVDVHVPIIITAIDNYDPLLDCTVIVDGNEVAAFQAENGNETTVRTIINVGTKTLVITCEDDAENSAQTDARTINVVDISGPDILIDNITDIMRKETAQFRANITDVSGIDSVSAVLTTPNGTTIAIDLHKSGDIYTGSYPTTIDSELGEYSLEIVANDTYGNGNSATGTFNVIHSYIVTLNVESPVYTSEQVTVSGTAMRDDGEAIPGSEVSLRLPSSNVTLDLNNNSFSTNFNAPSARGTYTIKAWILIGSREFNATDSLQVNARSSSGGSHGGSGGGSSGGGTPVMNLTGDEAGILENECDKDSDCGNGKQCNNGRCVGQIEEVVTENNDETLEPQPEPVVETAGNSGNLTQNENNGVGVGKASGFLSLSKINWMNLLWIIIAIVAIVAVIKMLSGNGKDERGIKYSEIEKYIKQRRKNFRD